MATQQEIEDLKRRWLNDPCWDIEDEEGFEAHRDELVAFHEMHRAKWANRLAVKADRLGVPGNIKLAQYVDGLEQRIKALEERLDEQP